MWLFRVADFFFLVFHMVLVILNLFGWIWKPTRKACLIVQALTAASWFGLGLIYGIGFCPFTEWHWRVLERLGERPQETSYLQYLVRRVFDWHVPAALVNEVTVVLFFIAVIASVIVNIRDRRKV